MLLAKLVRHALLSLIVEESTYVHLIAAGAIALNALVFVRVVQTLDCRMALRTLETTLAVVPPHTILKRVAILGGILEQVRRSSKVTCMMRVNATLRIVTILFRWTPACFIEKHEEYVALLFCINLIQSLIQAIEL